MKRFYERTVRLRAWKSLLGIEFLAVGDPEASTITMGHQSSLVLVDRSKRSVDWPGWEYHGVDAERSCLDHFALEISEHAFEKESKRLARAGLDVRTAEFPEIGARGLFFTDPEGNRVEFVCHALNRTEPSERELMHQDRPELRGISETALFVKDLSRACAFYEEVMGLSAFNRSERGCGFVVRSGHLLLLITEEKAKDPSETPGGTVPPCLVESRSALGAGHVAFDVSESQMALWRNHLEGHGIELLSEVAWKPGGRSIYFRDPDGHLLELATPGVWEIP
jgi:catechol 2,3-dioxygenase-like lactoylglutathione lyase family enzyme